MSQEAHPPHPPAGDVPSAGSAAGPRPGPGPAPQPASPPPQTLPPTLTIPSSTEPLTPPPATPPTPKGPAISDSGILRPIQESDYFTLDPEAISIISANIDEYYNQPLHIFPFWENENKPDRFHVLYRRQIEDRFPADADIRGRIYAYGRRVFDALRIHVIVKRLSQALAIIAFAVLAVLGPTVFAEWTSGQAGGQAGGVALAAVAMLAVVGIYYGVSTILFIQYRFRLENDSYELSREIVQRTRELQNLFTNARAMSDQAETVFSHDGKGWGERALFLTRLTMWIGARMEYLEKFAQMELWRVRRERYWMGWGGGISTVLVLLICLGAFFVWPAPSENIAGYRLLQALGVLLTLVVSWLSFFHWQTPMSAVKDKLGEEGWVRYASLDVDNTVGDQVRRDKERLVEYRALTRSR